jgi:hypothetical protein
MATLKWFIAVVIATQLMACSTVKPWERDVMARRSMSLDKNPMFLAMDDHVYFSKEAAAGGRTFDGGGCGCN